MGEAALIPDIPAFSSSFVHSQVQLLVRAFQVRGHNIANLDPLGMNGADLDNSMPSELTIEHYGWSEKDLDKEFELGAGILPRFKNAGTDKLSLRQIIDTCKKIYCNFALPSFSPLFCFTDASPYRRFHRCSVHPHSQP
jgi:hypothetical protein